MSDQKRRQYLHALGIQTWQLRTTDMKKKMNQIEVEPAHSPKEEPLEQFDWDMLKARVSVCTACALHKGRTQTVFGTGNRQADLLVVGEGPGANEDKQGEPFVGRAGQLLNSMLRAIGLQREQIYIANVVKCRPPNNRDPQPDEVEQCTPYLLRQIHLLKPKLILALGRIAAHHLLNTNNPMSSLRGSEFRYGESAVPLLVTYHPAYLLRAPREKRKAWQDMQLVAKKIGQFGE